MAGQEILSNWSNNHFSMIYSNVEESTAGVRYRFLEYICFKQSQASNKNWLLITNDTRLFAEHFNMEIWNRFLSRKKKKIQSLAVAQELYAELKELIYRFPKSEESRIFLLDEVKMQIIFISKSCLDWILFTELPRKNTFIWCPPVPTKHFFQHC